VLVTGATGFVGAALVNELLRRGRLVLCLVRAETPAVARERLGAALRPWTRDVERRLETGRLAVLRGDVCAPGAGVPELVRTALRGHVSALVHAAGSTRFAATADGEPQRTNVTGTRNVLELLEELGCREWHMISTAFVAGATGVAPESVTATPPAFRNAYEASKWHGEQLAIAAARRAEARLTIYRPSIVVGHSETGHASRFNGIYYLFRATSLVARAAEQQPHTHRHQIPLRIPASPHGRPNLICIDDVAAAFGDLVGDPAAQGGVYHLTHPEPPTNAQIKRVLEAHYDLAGGRFVTELAEHGLPATEAADASARLQPLFDGVIAAVQDYLFDAPHFDRSQVSRFVGRRPADWTDDRLRKLISAAELAGWRAIHADREPAGDPKGIAAYFSDFLPRQIAHSTLGRAKQLELNVRFDIGGSPTGKWWCCFRDGCVVAAEPATDQPTDITYMTSEPRFWAAVAGDMTGAELFLSGEATIEGNIERALKFATALESFVREHPYRRATPASAYESIAVTG
jgi:nucleoside-diphosphate-sugar epimerase